MKHEARKRNTILFTILILLVITLVYWTQYRPYAVTKACHKIALEESGYSENSDGWSLNTQRYYEVFPLCTNKAGLPIK